MKHFDEFFISNIKNELKASALAKEPRVICRELQQLETENVKLM